MTFLTKRFTAFLLLFLCLVFFKAEAAEIWVSPKGNNSNPGSKAKPLADIGLALRKARELRRLSDPSISNGITIILRGGVYTIDEPLFIRPEDSGTAASPTVFEAAKGEIPIISGGITVKRWH